MENNETLTVKMIAADNENENYTRVNTSDVFHVMDKPSPVVVTADDIYVREDALVKV